MIFSPFNALLRSPVLGQRMMDLGIGYLNGQTSVPVRLNEFAISDKTFARAKKVFSEQQIVDLTACAGNYVMVAMLLAMTEATVPPGKEEPLKSTTK